jgi:ubiquinone/menaquinone biosynthesis C-methylase UbiE
MNEVNHWKQGPIWWQWLGSPLRPSVEDVAVIQREIVTPLNQELPAFEPHQERDSETSPWKSPQICLLGVTPELASLNWPKNSFLTAIDSSEKMIQSVWIGDRPQCRKAILGDWRSLPFEDQSCHVILGDGCLTLLDYPQSYRLICQELSRILHPQGYLSLRCFLRPEIPETVDQVLADLWAEKIETFHSFKLRLAMALQEDLEEGVSMKEVWQNWEQSIPNPNTLFEILNWPKALESTITMYQNSTAYYTFPTLTELRQIMSPWFREVTCYFPQYELGDRCPTLIYRPQTSISFL